MIFQATTSPASSPASAPRAVQSAKPTRRRGLAIACWSYLLTVVAFWVFIRQTGDRSWIGTFVLLLPRWPLLVPFVLLGPLVLLAKNWWFRSVVAVAVILVIAPLMGFRIAMPNSAPDRGDLRFLTFNVHRQHVDADRLVEYIAAANPDVIAIQDWSSANSEKLFAGGMWHVQCEGELLVASRYPIGRVTPIDFADDSKAPKAERGAAACFELLTPTGPINLINVHLASPHSGLIAVLEDKGYTLGENVERRWRESEALRDFVDRAPEPLILAGDFNTTDDSPIFKEHWGDFTDAFVERGSGFGYTYINDHTQMRIDHILAGQSFQPVRCWIGPEAGSPHRPLVGDFVFR